MVENLEKPIGVSYKNSPSMSKRTAIRMKKSSRFSILLYSVLSTLLAIANPLLTYFANGLQTQNLYTGLMMTKGQIPYSDVFATGGFLYYVTIALSYLLGSSIWLLIVQFIAYYVSGIYFYKLVYYVAQSEIVSIGTTLIFYIMNIVLGFGGMYPIQWALPFMLISLWFLIKFCVDNIVDEAFIFYGILAAFSLFIDPQTLIFWLCSFVLLTATNIKQKQSLRGFYQFLCVVFGMILIAYTVGYFMFNLQIISSYIDKAIFYPFTYFARTNHSFLLSLAIQIVVLLGSGCLFGLWDFIQNRKKASYQIGLNFIACIFIIYAIMAIFSRDFNLYHFLPALPFGLLLTSNKITILYQKVIDRRSHRRQYFSGKSLIVDLFVKKTYYLPLLLVSLSIGLLVYNTYQNVTLSKERRDISHYLTTKIDRDGKIYVWDKVASIYSQTRLKSASQFVLPHINTAQKNNEKILKDELLQHGAKYFILNKNEKLPNELKSDIKKHYQEVPLSNITHFVLYRFK